MALAESTETTETSGPQPVQSLVRGLAILSQFTADDSSLSLAELSRRTGLHRATVYRFVKTLEAAGYLVSLGAGAYGIGPVWAMSLYALGTHNALANILSVDLEALAETSEETVAIGVKSGDNVQIAHVLPPSRSFVPVLPPGHVYPLHSTWNVHAQILLASSDESTKRRMLAVPQTRHTENTVVDPKETRARLERVLEEGVAYDLEMFHLGTCAVGVPVVSKGKVVAALALVVPVERFTDKDVARFTRQLRSAAQAMGERLDVSVKG